MDKGRRITRYWLVFFAYMLFIFLVSSIPGERLPGFEWKLTDSLAHFFEYLIFGILCLRAMKISYPESRPRNLFILAILVSFAYALSDEIHQYFVPGRLPQARDLISDSVGCISGIFIYRKIKIKGPEWQR